MSFHVVKRWAVLCSIDSLVCQIEDQAEELNSESEW